MCRDALETVENLRVACQEHEVILDRTLHQVKGNVKDGIQRRIRSASPRTVVAAKKSHRCATSFHFTHLSLGAYRRSEATVEKAHNSKETEDLSFQPPHRRAPALSPIISIEAIRKMTL